MICEGESEDSWNYFFDCLSTYLQDQRVITFMSDRQKGLKKAVKSIFPVLRQRYCARHLYANFRAKFPGPKLRKLFWIAVNACTEEDFQDAMNSIKAADFGAHKWLIETCKEDPSTWSKHGFDRITKVDHVTNNMTESFNAWMGKMRQKPVISMLEWYRTKVMKRFFTRQQKALSWQTRLPPNVNAKVEKNQRQGRKFLAIPASEYLFEVYDDKKYIINLREKTCQCNEWQVCGVPCKHAMSCILYMRYDPVDYVSPYLTTEAYLRTYSGMINAIPDESKWPTNTQIPPLKPPVHKRKNRAFKQGRLQVNRRRELNEAPKVHKRSVHVTCKVCKEVGHNKRTCRRKDTNIVPIQVSRQSTTVQDLGSQISSVDNGRGSQSRI
ncbi:PREDICTED: uncharacterized protein LOC105956512 [Erythranthe guttata]|uniref:uncharacterized protein LOC105956512 n=1 Tax=Erythranthe guttata TaxID=4155 RepID=UPI00064DDEBD|nr:PREDICTED: uncharacterized protein LOC105956512 [Erythranthe guttata]|eukprot:XP_012835819.1 PREDICTED: uncharacterized protein LOC105956512 [Erythranthe guttata]